MSLSINRLRQVSGVGAKTVRAFIEAGFQSLEALVDVTPEQLLAIPGIGESTAKRDHRVSYSDGRWGRR